MVETLDSVYINAMTDDLKHLIEAAKNAQPTPEQKEQQRRSFAYGNAAFENELITREMIDREAEKLSREGDDARKDRETG
jgi:hypothetical protein